MTSKEVTFDLQGTTLAGKFWCNNSNASPQRIIALHGWLDNAASFDFIAPHIHNAEILALDLSGHGCSDHRSYPGAYNIWQDLIEILMVADRMEWQTFSVMGHSRGSVIAMLLSGCFPERVVSNVMIEWVLPDFSKTASVTQQITKSISSSLLLHHRARHYYDTKESAVLARVNGKFSVLPEAAFALAQRGVHYEEGGYFWSSDPKLLGPSEITLSQDVAQESIDAFTKKSLVILGDKGLLAPRVNHEPWIRDNPKLDIHCIPGGHHLHMSSDIHVLSDMLMLINDYFS